MEKALRACAHFDARLAKIRIKSTPKAAYGARKKGAHPISGLPEIGIDSRAYRLKPTCAGAPFCDPDFLERSALG
jgi:hypothetical protein